MKKPASLLRCSVMQLRCLVMLILLSVGHAAVSSQKSNNASESMQSESIIGRPFTAADIKIGKFIKLNNRVPSESCASTTVQYTQIIPTELGTYRVPHSRILMDDKTCGAVPPNATEDELWIDDYMELMPIDFLFNETIAHDRGTIAAFNKLFDERRVLQAFFKFSRGQRETDMDNWQTWIGFERFADRVCGKVGAGAITFPQNSFVFFGKHDDNRIDITDLVTRVTSGEVVLEKHHPYHVSFMKSSDSPDDHLCPQIFLDRSAANNQEQSNARMCFPASASIEREGGKRIRMSELRVGDRVRDGSGDFSPIHMFSHRDSSSAMHNFLKIRTASHHSITLSHGHYLPTPAGLTAAGDLKEGDVIFTLQGLAHVLSISHVRERGLYNPQTLSGHLVVGEIVASAYTSAISPRIAHGLLAPLRAAFTSTISLRSCWSRILPGALEARTKFVAYLWHSLQQPLPTVLTLHSAVASAIAA